MSTAPREVLQPRRDGATQAAARGTAAFGSLYTEHFDGLYDFVVRIVRDHDLAGEIVQATFTKAWNELRDGNELTYPKSWLYAVARNNALDELRRRQRLTDEPLAYAEPDTSRMSDPQEVAEANELVELVWDSAAALNPDEYSLLDLHVRHGFGPAELADALDLERGAVYTRLSRLRRSLEASVASTLLVRRGNSDCADLAAIVSEHGGEGVPLTPELRSAIQAHVDECDVCCAAKRRSLSPVALFGALTPIAPIGPAREGILAAIVPDGGHAAAGAAAGGAAAVAATARHGAKARYLLVGASGIAATAAIVAVALSNGEPVKDPSQAASVDHTAGVASSDRTITMRWSPAKDAQGYSVMFSRNRSDEPPARENVKGTQYTSAPLGAGRWWFILRTHGKDGSWTDTLRRGPFVIVIPTAVVPPPKAAATPARHKRPRKVRHRGPPQPAATAPKQIVLDFHASAPPRGTPVPKPKATPKKKKAPKPKPPKPTKPPKPPKPPPTPTPAPPASPQPAPPAVQPVAPVPPAQADDDDDEHENEDDEDDQGEDHDRGGGDHGGKGHGHDD